MEDSEGFRQQFRSNVSGITEIVNNLSIKIPDDEEDDIDIDLDIWDEDAETPEFRIIQIKDGLLVYNEIQFKTIFTIPHDATTIQKHKDGTWKMDAFDPITRSWYCQDMKEGVTYVYRCGSLTEKKK